MAFELAFGFVSIAALLTLEAEFFRIKASALPLVGIQMGRSSVGLAASSTHVQLLSIFPPDDFCTFVSLTPIKIKPRLLIAF